MKEYTFLIRFNYGETQMVKVKAKSIKKAQAKLSVIAPEWRESLLLPDLEKCMLCGGPRNRA